MIVGKQSYNTVEFLSSTVYDSNKSYYLNLRYLSKFADGTLYRGNSTLFWQFVNLLTDGWYYVELHELPNIAGTTEDETYYYNTVDEVIQYWPGEGEQIILTSLDNRTPEEVLNFLVTSSAINTLSNRVVTNANLSKCFDNCEFLLKIDTVEALKKKEAFNAASDLVLTIE